MIYDDGIIEIYSLPSTGDGNLPSSAGTLVGRQYFGDRTVGFNRYYTAKANHDRLDKVVECWAMPNVDTTNYAVIGNARFYIRQVQYTEADGLRVMVLSLERQNDEQNG